MFTLPLVIALLSQSAIIAAAPINSIQARDNLDDIESALAPVSQSLAQVDAAVLALDGGPVTANNLLVLAQQTEATTNQATFQVQQSGNLGAIRAARLRRITGALTDQTTTTVGDLVSRKPVLDNLGVSSVALDSLQRQKISTMALAAALEEKVPRIGQRIAEEDRVQIESVLDSGIAAYAQPAVQAVPVAVVPATAPAAAPAAAAPAPAAPVPAAPVPAAPAPAPAAPAPSPAPGIVIPAAGSVAPLPAQGNLPATPPVAVVPAPPAAAPAPPAAAPPAAAPAPAPPAAAPAPPAAAPVDPAAAPAAPAAPAAQPAAEQPAAEQPWPEAAQPAQDEPAAAPAIPVAMIPTANTPAPVSAVEADEE